MASLASRQSSRSWLVPITVAGVLYATFMSLYLVPYHGDFSAFLCLPQRFMGQGPYQLVRLCISQAGYDGAFYYAVAQSPFDIPRAYIDAPSIRHGRLLFPLLSWTLSGGDAQRLLWAMPCVNFAAILGLTWLGAKIAEHYGRSRWWGLLLTIGVNAYLPPLRDLTDSLAAMAAVGLIAAWLLRWPAWLLGGWGIAAVLSREQNIAIVAIVGLAALIERDRRRAAATALTGAVWIGWLLILKHLYGEWPIAGQNLAIPFKGICYAWTHLERPSGGISLNFAAKITLLTASLLAVPLVVRRGSFLTGLVTLAGAGLATVGGIAIFEDPWSYTRVLNWLPLGIWLYGVESNKRWPIFLLAPAALWPVMEVFFAFRLQGLIGA